MLGLVPAGFFAFYILRASTPARRLNAWTVQPLQVFGAAVIVAGIIIMQATSSDAAITGAPIQ